MNIVKILKIILITLILGGIVVPLAGCASESDSESLSENQVVTVQRGNLTIDITAAGNLALSRTEDLAIDLFYEEGTVEEVLVEEGDTVEEGQLLVKLDTDEWEDELSALEDQVTAKERALHQAQINLQTAKQSLQNARDNEAVKNLALLNAQISLDQAQRNLHTGITATDYDAITAELNKAKAWYEYVEDGLQEATDDEDDWLLALERAEERLETAQVNYDTALAGYGTGEVAIRKKQVESAKMALAQAQEDLAKVAEDVSIKEQQVILNEGKITDAQKALADAQEELDEAKSKSSIIVAPFAGFITKVNVEGGDEVLTGTVAVQLADPNKFEADILVSEMDILQVKLGGEAWVQVDAMLGMSLPAKVTHISPTATIQSGVVNYEVKVEIQSFETVIKERQGPAPMMLHEDFQLREGLTVTVSILVEERTNVLLVPNAAITREGGQTYVQVLKDGVIEERAIKTGISDWQYTEVTDGLSEGEKVVVPQGTTTPTTPQSPGGIHIPGMGRPPR